MEEEQEEKNKKAFLKDIDGKLGWALFVIVILFLLNASFIFIFPSIQESAQFGDTFGAVNALFSGCAFVGLIYAIFLQRKDLKLQYDELRATREEFEIQNETLRKQRFENTFFNMLNLHNEVVSSLEVSSNKGRKVFIYFLNEVKLRWSNKDNPSHKLKTIEDICEDFYKSWDYVLGHYFRNLYCIVKFVDESDIEKDKQDYVNILRAQLSDHELIILFYNFAYYWEGEKFKIYIEKYALLNNLSIERILDKEHMRAFTKDAYGGKYPE